MSGLKFWHNEKFYEFYKRMEIGLTPFGIFLTLVADFFYEIRMMTANNNEGV